VFALVAIAAGLLGIGILFVVPQLDNKQAAAPVAKAAPPSGSPSTSTATTVQSVETVKVRVSVDPPDAVLSVDGREVEGNPFVATFPKDDKEHTLGAVAENCQDHAQSIRLRGDLALLVAMKCKRDGLHVVPRRARRPPRRAPAEAPPASPPTEAQGAETPAEGASTAPE
jgi:hypothetical protein